VTTRNATNQLVGALQQDTTRPDGNAADTRASALVGWCDRVAWSFLHETSRANIVLLSAAGSQLLRPSSPSAPWRRASEHRTSLCQEGDEGRIEVPALAHRRPRNERSGLSGEPDFRPGADEAAVRAFIADVNPERRDLKTRARPRACLQPRGRGSRTRLRVKTTGRDLSPAEDRARLTDRGAVARWPEDAHRRDGYPPRRKAGFTILGAEERPLANRPDRD